MSAHDTASAALQEQALQWAKSFQVDPHLSNAFPLDLGGGVTALMPPVQCPQCATRIDYSMVHGRVTRKATLVHAEGNAYCLPCQRITHIVFQMQRTGDGYRLEWQDGAGEWHAIDKKSASAPGGITRVGDALRELFRAS